MVFCWLVAGLFISLLICQIAVPQVPETADLSSCWRVIRVPCFFNTKSALMDRLPGGRLLKSRGEGSFFPLQWSLPLSGSAPAESLWRKKLLSSQTSLSGLTIGATLDHTGRQCCPRPADGEGLRNRSSVDTPSVKVV